MKYDHNLRFVLIGDNIIIDLKDYVQFRINEP